MLPANSPLTKYLAAGSGLLTVGFLAGVLPTDPRVSIAFLIATAFAYTATFYFLSRALTRRVVEVSPRRSAMGFAVAGVGLSAWMYATLVAEVDLTAAGDLPRAVLALTIAALAIGLADVGWTTGAVAESLALKRAEDSG